MKIATSTGDFSPYTNRQEDAIKFLHDSGFRCVDYNFGIDYFHKNGAYGNAVDAHIDSVKRTMDKYEMEFVQSHGPIKDPFADDPTEIIGDTVQSAKVCDALGIPTVVVHSGFRAGYTKEQTIEGNIKYYREILNRTEGLNVNILLENFNNDPRFYLINQPEDMRIVLDEINHPRFHALLDVGHANLFETPIDKFVKILGDDLYGLHIHDNDGKADFHRGPFFGNFNFDVLLTALKEIGYDRAFTFEAIHFMPQAEKRLPTVEKPKFAKMPLELRIEAQKLLYKMGQSLLSAYDVLEY